MVSSRPLQDLECGVCNLTTLPALPATLEWLYCYGNQLTALPDLPATLKILYCYQNQLTSFPVDILKVDRCFVQDLHLIPANQAIVSTIIRMAKQLNLEVVAEGVECEQELEILRAEGCDLIQGFYYSKPLPFTEFAI